MTHALRRYTSNRGSALFMVISTMTALMIACVAMYFSVISSRTTEYATFFQQQSYQSATSIADMIIAGLNDRTLATGDNDLFSVMKELQPGESISTGVNDFTGSFATDGVLSDAEAERLAQLGAYSVDITRLPDEKVAGVNNMTYDIAVTSKVSGASEVTHTYVHLALDKPSYPSVDMDVFASTGYVPNDSYLDGGVYITDVFYDTEFTFMNMLGGGQEKFIGDMRAGGSVMADSYMLPTKTTDTDWGDYVRPSSWYIRGDFSNNFSGGLQLQPGSKILVGGDFSHIGGGAAVAKVEGDGMIDIFVVGDLNITNGANYTNVRLHVNGDINIENKGYPSMSNCQVFLNGNLNCIGFDSDNEKNIRENVIKPAPWNGNSDAVMTIEEVIEMLDAETRTKSFAKWEIDDSIVSDDITIELNATNTEQEGVHAFKMTYIIAYPGSESALDEETKPDKITTGANIIGFKGNDSGDNKAIIIDTGDSEDNVMTLRVQPYLDLDGDGTPETFAWTRTVNNNSSLAILVKGRGQVIIDVPEGVTYQSNSRSTFMHYSWFMTLGGKVRQTTNMANIGGSWQNVTTDIYDSKALTQDGSITPSQLTLDLIHDQCNDGCDYCKDEYKLVRTDKVCGYCKELVDNGTLKEDDVMMIDVICEHHGRVKTFCPNTGCKSRVNTDPADYPTDIPTKTNSADKVWSGKTGLCSRRFDRTVFDSTYGTRNDILEKIKYTKKNDDGTTTREVIYPKTDIFLVCANESADIRFGIPIGGTEMFFNSFYGFIYAPYMSYKSIGGEGQFFRFMGALVVSDYIIYSGLPVSSVYPEKMPSDFTGGENLDGVPKNWKLDFVSN